VWTWGSSFFGQLGRTIDLPCDDLYDVFCATMPGHAAQLGESAIAILLAGSLHTCAVVGPRARLRCLDDTTVRFEGVPLEQVTFAAGATLTANACVQTADAAVYCWGRFMVPEDAPAGDLVAYPDVIRIALPSE
jgi:hypothetical protein